MGSLVSFLILMEINLFPMSHKAGCRFVVYASLNEILSLFILSSEICQGHWALLSDLSPSLKMMVWTHPLCFSWVAGHPLLVCGPLLSLVPLVLNLP